MMENRRDVNRYPEQIDDLLGYLTESLPDYHPYQGLTAAPSIETMPEVWMLGSSPSSAMLAAQKGLPYTFAQFINGEGGPQYTEAYRNNFVSFPILAGTTKILSLYLWYVQKLKKKQKEWLPVWTYPY